jgi:hypothetical protein
MRLLLRALLVVAALLVCGREAWADDLKSDVQQAKQQLQAVSELVATQTAAFAVCSGSTDCPLRLFIGKAFLQTTLKDLLQGRTAAFRMTGKTGVLANSGGGGLGCGWFAEVDDSTLSADLTVGQVASSWVATQGLTLDPGFVFDARAQIHGHVKGPPGVCGSFPSYWISCDCPSGGGAGSSVGVNARITNAWPLALDLKADQTGPLLNLRQRSDLDLRTTVQVGLQYLPTLGIPIDFAIKAQSLSTFRPPTLFGVEGEVTLPSGGGGAGNTKKFQLSFTSPRLGTSPNGLEYLTRVQLVWLP